MPKAVVNPLVNHCAPILAIVVRYKYSKLRLTYPLRSIDGPFMAVYGPVNHWLHDAQRCCISQGMP